MPASNQYMAALPHVLRETPQEVADYVHARLSRGRGTMVMLVRPDGRVRVIRDEMLEDDTGRGVVGHFTKQHSAEHIRQKLEEFVAKNLGYLGR